LSVTHISKHYASTQENTGQCDDPLDLSYQPKKCTERCNDDSC